MPSGSGSYLLGRFSGWLASGPRQPWDFPGDRLFALVGYLGRDGFSSERRTPGAWEPFSVYQLDKLWRLSAGSASLLLTAGCELDRTMPRGLLVEVLPPFAWFQGTAKVETGPEPNLQNLRFP